MYDRRYSHTRAKKGQQIIHAVKLTPSIEDAGDLIGEAREELDFVEKFLDSLRYRPMRRQNYCGSVNGASYAFGICFSRDGSKSYLQEFIELLEGNGFESAGLCAKLSKELSDERKLVLETQRNPSLPLSYSQCLEESRWFRFVDGLYVP